MNQIKLAALSMMPFALLCSIATAQEQPPACPVTPPPAPVVPQIKSQVQPPAAPQHEEVFGPYVPYTGPLLQKAAPPPQPMVADALPTSCNTTAPPPVKTQPEHEEVFGPYVPYAPPQGVSTQGVSAPKEEATNTPPPPTACYTPNAQPAPSALSSPTVSASHEPADGPGDSPTSPPLNLAQPAASDVAINSPAPAPGDPAGAGAFVRSIPVPPVVNQPREIRPFRSVAVGFKADTLGLGVEVATPVASRFNLRTSFNIFAFNDPFSIDGINYEARLHLQSTETTLDWFPIGGLHVSPGMLYLKNSMSAPASVGPGQTFVLGSQTFTNSVDDPVSGTSSVVYPHAFAPLLLLGYGNIIPRTGRHLSIPFEFGAAYTGAPKINVALTGTACAPNGCLSFSGSSAAQASLKQEIYNLNEDLKRYPLFPIVSLGLAYHF
jgi:hypothetical protein